MITYLAASNLAPALRRLIYRQWCSAFAVTVNSTDLNDVAPPRRVIRHPALDFDNT